MGKEISKRTRCPGCAAIGSDTDKDNLAHYADGSICMKPCGYKELKGANQTKSNQITDLIPGVHLPLVERGINDVVCQKYNVRTANFTGRIGEHEVQDEVIKIFPYYDNDSRLVRQKIKAKSNKKIMSQKGDKTTTKMFGQQLFTPRTGIPVVVTEGEEDAMAMFQMTGLPSVSIINGSSSALKDCTANFEWLSGFKEVLLCFDQDEPGQKAFDEVVGLFDPGFAKKVILPLKDANEMLLAKRDEEVKKATWNAQVVRPNTIVFPKDIRDKVLQRPTYGRPWPWSSMTKATYGRRLGEAYLLAAATSIGKTEFLRQIISFVIDEGDKVGWFSFEQQAEQSMLRIISGNLGKRLYIPGAEGWDEEMIIKELEKYGDNLALYQPESGKVSIESIIINIKFLVKVYGMKFFVVDNLKALSTYPVIEGKRVPVYEYASHACSLLVTLAKQLNINIFIVNHLSEDKISKQAYVTTSPKHADEYLSRTAEEQNNYINRPGMTFESGRMPTIENIFGGGAIKDLMDGIIVLARNRMADDPEEHRTVRVRFLKNRIDSKFEGYEFRLQYNYQTGNLDEVYNQEISNREDIDDNSTTFDMSSQDTSAIS